MAGHDDGAPGSPSAEGPDAGPLDAAPRAGRRLSDKIFVAFHHACDAQEFPVAEQLLKTLEVLILRRPSAPEHNRRKQVESLVAAYERLWHLRHRE